MVIESNGPHAAPDNGRQTPAKLYSDARTGCNRGTIKRCASDPAVELINNGSVFFEHGSSGYRATGYRTVIAEARECPSRTHQCSSERIR